MLYVSMTCQKRVTLCHISIYFFHSSLNSAGTSDAGRTFTFWTCRGGLIFFFLWRGLLIFSIAFQKTFLYNHFCYWYFWWSVKFCPNSRRHCFFGLILLPSCVRKYLQKGPSKCYLLPCFTGPRSTKSKSVSTGGDLIDLNCLYERCNFYVE